MEALATAVEQMGQQHAAELSDVRASLQYLQQEQGGMQQRVSRLETHSRPHKNIQCCGMCFHAVHVRTTSRR